jgi:hypothetical protein
MPLAAILNLLLVAAVVAFSLSTAMAGRLRTLLHLPQLADRTAAVNIDGDISNNRHSRPTVFVSFYAPALRFAGQNNSSIGAALPLLLLG